MTPRDPFEKPRMLRPCVNDLWLQVIVVVLLTILLLIVKHAYGYHVNVILYLKGAPGRIALYEYYGAWYLGVYNESSLYEYVVIEAPWGSISDVNASCSGTCNVKCTAYYYYYSYFLSYVYFDIYTDEEVCTVLVRIGDDVSGATVTDTAATPQAILYDWLYTTNDTYADAVIYNLTAPPGGNGSGGSSSTTTTGNASVVVNFPSTITVVQQGGLSQKDIAAIGLLIGVVGIAVILIMARRL